MELTHTFTVPTSVEDTWAHFQDIAAVAECFPGAVVESVEGDTFTGSVKVKLGPIALTYKGSGTFVDKNESDHVFTVEAKGKDKRGNGTAGADVVLSMSEAAGGATDVKVVTELAITGKPAQFGRGVMQDVSDKLLGQFVSCLEQRLSAGDADAEEVPADEPVAATDGATAGEAPPQPTPIGTAASAAARPTAPPPRVTTASGSAGTSAPAGAEELDLGATVLPVLAKAYWKQGLGALVVLLLVWRLVRR
ncbi:MAG: carbon monoxide dehydrogenase [Nocardioides sp.]|nr:carbon monoxide dehydrogenase [Nocardioides sp.]